MLNMQGRKKDKIAMTHFLVLSPRHVEVDGILKFQPWLL